GAVCEQLQAVLKFRPPCAPVALKHRPPEQRRVGEPVRSIEPVDLAEAENVAGLEEDNVDAARPVLQGRKEVGPADRSGDGAGDCAVPGSATVGRSLETSFAVGRRSHASPSCRRCESARVRAAPDETQCQPLFAQTATACAPVAPQLRPSSHPNQPESAGLKPISKSALRTPKPPASEGVSV